MKKLLIIAVAAMCVVACGPRRSAKSQESQKDATNIENTEASEQHCCGHHGIDGCAKEAAEKDCAIAAEKAAETVEAVKKEVETAKKEVETVKKEAESVKEEAVQVEQLGRKAEPKPRKPVPNPYK